MHITEIQLSRAPLAIYPYAVPWLLVEMQRGCACGGPIADTAAGAKAFVLFVQDDWCEVICAVMQWPCKGCHGGIGS
jgi:hypothetical protein